MGIKTKKKEKEKYVLVQTKHSVVFFFFFSKTYGKNKGKNNLNDTEQSIPLDYALD